MARYDGSGATIRTPDDGLARAESGSDMKEQHSMTRQHDQRVRMAHNARSWQGSYLLTWTQDDREGHGWADR